MIDTFEVKSFLDPAECAGLRAELRQAAGSQATVLSRDPGGEAKPLVRRSTRMRVPARTAEQITARLMQQTDALEQRFGRALSSCEPPQFLRYLPGDFFVAHQDGNTPLIHDDSRFRKVSAVIFLTAFSEGPAPESYGGGALVLHEPYSGPDLRVPLTPLPGTLICFRAETTHEVLPVTHGERFTIVSWYW
ncbi:MAG: SM-20-related protein [Bradyrhizobium sp.]|nr:SM-20-related protein [Bradyrhizobium sp.]